MCFLWSVDWPNSFLNLHKQAIIAFSYHNEETIVEKNIFTVQYYFWEAFSERYSLYPAGALFQKDR